MDDDWSQITELLEDHEVTPDKRPMVGILDDDLLEPIMVESSESISPVKSKKSGSG